MLKKLIRSFKTVHRFLWLTALMFGLAVVILVSELPLSPLEKNQSFAEVKTHFLHAIQAYDLKTAKRYYQYLQEKNPYAPFVTDIAPAYLADVYIHYAEQLAFNPEAAELLLAQARILAPSHPLLVGRCLNCQKAPALADANALSEALNKTEQVLSQETQAYIAELSALDTTLKSLESMPIDLKVDEELMVDAIETETVAELLEETQEQFALESQLTAEIPRTEDACLLSYFTRTGPISTCMDVVSDHHYGPALFVVGNEKSILLAFAQNLATDVEYETLCEQTPGCIREDSKKEAASNALTLDLSDVEATVRDYNAFCALSSHCEGINSTAVSAKPLAGDALKKYADLLSQKTGYRYHVMSPEQAFQISEYFEMCVAKGECPGLSEIPLMAFLKENHHRLLVRDIAFAQADF